jgi:hypothetical protein
LSTDGRQPTPGPREATETERADWDRLTVRAPGGHVYQSLAWAEQRARLGWRPLHVMLDEDHAALVLLRPFPWIGGASAYIPRGPVADPAGAPSARRVAALADWLRSRGVAVVATDAEVPAVDAPYGAGLRAAGFRPIPEIQPSRHRVSLALARETDDAAVRAGFAKSTRQRIAGAERDGVVVERHDRAGWDGAQGLYASPSEPLPDALARFATLLEGTGERRGFRFGPRQVFLDWWTAAHAAGYLVYLDARDGSEPTRSLGGLILYRHGGRLSTASCTCSAGGPSSSRSARAASRWTWAASTSDPSTASPARVTRWRGCTSTSSRSGPPGWR